MKIALSLIKQFISQDLAVEEIADICISLGIEVEEVLEREMPFSGVVVAEVVHVEPHPNKKHLLVLQLMTPNDKYSIVCGDTSLCVNDIVPLAQIGATIAISSEPLAKKTFGGIISEGMLCTEYELGLGDNKRSIIRLDASFALGEDLAKNYMILFLM